MTKRWYFATFLFMFKNMKQITVIKNNFSILKVPKGTALIVGNFEGIHKGHQALLEKLIQAASEKNLTPVVYTFYPHPSAFFSKNKMPTRLMSLEQKISKLSKNGVEVIVVRPFNQNLANMSYQGFLEHLKNDLNVKHLIIGEDFAFGKNRLGTASTIQQAAPEMGMDVEVIQDVKCEKVGRYSSSMIRELLKAGEVKKAGLALGEPFTLKTYLYEDDYCNLVAHLRGYTPIKKGVYFAKVQYTKQTLGYESVIVPVTIAENKAIIRPLAEMPDLTEGRIYLSLIDKIEK